MGVVWQPACGVHALGRAVGMLDRDVVTMLEIFNAQAALAHAANHADGV